MMQMPQENLTVHILEHRAVQINADATRKVGGPYTRT